MRKKLPFLTFLCLTFFSSLTLTAQEEPYTLQVFNQAVYYGMYEATVDEPVPADAIRNSNSSYGKMLTEEQLASFGNRLTMRVTLNPLCDNYDRIGNVNLAFVPKGQTTYVYNEVQRIELGRFITPFMNKNNTSVQEVPYEWQIDNITQIFHDENITSEFDLWVELEVYGYQGGPGQGGAAVEIAGCANRNDVYQGSLEFISTEDPLITNGDDNTFIPLSFKYELKNYTLDGTDVIGETVRTINFTLDQDVPNAKFYLITSNHGSNSGGEEYIRRQHYVYLDDEQVFTYKPGGVSCVPFFNYNTQPSCIYYDCSQNPSPPRPDTNAAWSWNNWCPGDKIPIRVIDLGNLEAGEHSFKIDVPDAQFAGGQGYFPMSVYLQGFSQTLGVEDFNTTAFTLFPNPVVDIAEIQTVDGSSIRNVTVVNTLGQIVYSGSSEKVNLSQLQSGVYIVNVKFDDNRTATQKLIKN
ncbi:peptide-N-glycosidase F-related protein [Flavobacterium beibuense]|uniref:peptide-N-glycosidase F-related protein n=1 Tax=Flavobacterium beibuense TaxID=657326 RepID=UPI0013EDCF62|nr:peptide-N-glycosidase F-related protein [Flavobacterium beibuense]